VAQSGSRIGRSNGNLTKHEKCFTVNGLISLLYKILDTKLPFVGHREQKSLTKSRHVSFLAMHKMVLQVSEVALSTLEGYPLKPLGGGDCGFWFSKS